ncbi:MAG: isoprenyl transferase [Alphaproteobacteria bacterium]
MGPTSAPAQCLPVPNHVAIIMDGNGRWAQQRGLPRGAGHVKGVEALRRTVRAAGEMGISYLTLFGFSSENWSRPAGEINDLMGLLKRFIRQDLAELHRANVRVKVIGDGQGLSREIVSLIHEAERLTGDNTALTLTVAFNYGARREITEAVRALAQKVARQELRPEDISPKMIDAHLQTSDIPDPDLLIRTSGECRISNFLLWQCAYSEFVFLDCLWPEFDAGALRGAVAQYQGRQRRFGGAVSQPAE